MHNNMTRIAWDRDRQTDREPFKWGQLGVDQEMQLPRIVIIVIIMIIIFIQNRRNSYDCAKRLINYNWISISRKVEMQAVILKRY